MDLEEAGNLQKEIGMMRVVTRRLLEMARGCKDLGELGELKPALSNFPLLYCKAISLF